MGRGCWESRETAGFLLQGIHSRNVPSSRFQFWNLCVALRVQEGQSSGLQRAVCSLSPGVGAGQPGPHAHWAHVPWGRGSSHSRRSGCAYPGREPGCWAGQGHSGQHCSQGPAHAHPQGTWHKSTAPRVVAVSGVFTSPPARHRSRCWV